MAAYLFCWPKLSRPPSAIAKIVHTASTALMHRLQPERSSERWVTAAAEADADVRTGIIICLRRYIYMQVDRRLRLDMQWGIAMQEPAPAEQYIRRLVVRTVFRLGNRRGNTQRESTKRAHKKEKSMENIRLHWTVAPMCILHGRNVHSI